MGRERSFKLKRTFLRYRIIGVAYFNTRREIFYNVAAELEDCKMHAHIGDFIKLPPRSIRSTVDLPFIGVVVAKSGSGRTGPTHLRSVDLADDTIRQFSTNSIDAHAT